MSFRKIILCGALIWPIASTCELVAQTTSPTGADVSDAKLRRRLERAKLNIGARAFKEALENVDLYLQAYPHDVEAHAVRAKALLGLERYQESARVYRAVLKQKPRDVEVLYGFAFACEKSGQRETAIRAYQHVLKLAPRHVVCRNNLAWVLATAPEDHLRNGRLAIALSQQSIQELGRDKWWMGSTLAAAVAETGDFETAIRIQEMALEMSPLEPRKEMRARLELFKKGQPYRLPK